MRKEFDAHRYLRNTRHKPAPKRRSTDRDWRPLWVWAVAILTFLALLATFQ